MFLEISLQLCNFIKKETLSQVFSCEFYKISKNTFLQNTSGRLLLDLIVLFFLDKTRVISLAHDFSEPVAWWCSATKDALKNFAKFPEKYLCWSLFLIKLTTEGSTLAEISQNKHALMYFYLA